MKKFVAWLNRWLLKDKSLKSKLNLVFFFFFFVPVAALIYFGLHYNILNDHYLPHFFLAMLAFAFVGLNLLRKVFDEISGFSSTLSRRVQSAFPEACDMAPESDELGQMTQAIGIIDQRLTQAQAELTHRAEEIGTLKGLSDLCYVTADPDEILYVALERALSLTDSDVGSIMLLEGPDNARFQVRAAIGLEQWVKTHSHVPFESSIAKYAVLNKAAMVVDDVEKDTRFGRANRPHYGTKAFICLPIKTSRAIIGVLTISRRANDQPYDPEAARVLEPLISNAAFTYENLLFKSEQTRKDRYLDTLAAILEIFHSTLQGDEMLRACLNEVRAVVPFEAAFMLLRDPKRLEELVVHEAVMAAPVAMVKGNRHFIAEGSLLDKLMRQQTSRVTTDTRTLTEENQMEMMADALPRPVHLVALRSKSGVEGVLALAMPAEHPSRDQAFLESAACCLALALEHSRLRDAVARRDRELDSIRQIGGALASSTFDIRQVLNYTMEMIRLIMSVEAGALYLVKEGELEFAVDFNIDPDQRKPVRLKLGQGIPGYVASRGESLMVNENQPTSYFMPQVDADKNFTVQSALCVPMVSQGRVIGVIEVLNKQIGDFDANDRDLLQSIAASVSIAVENAHLYKSTVTMAENERGIRRMFQKFVPKEVLEKILCGPDKGVEPTEELKTLTLLNIDIRGFSGLVKLLGPQKTVSLLNAFFSIMGGIVFKHHGIVDKYLGDGFLAIFGAPVSSIADADNALNASLEMLASLDTINTGLAKEMGVSLKIGISVHTGEVVVGNIGFEMKMDYTVIGDAVNAVFRLQDMVGPYPDSIFFSENTLRAARKPFTYLGLDARLGELEIYELTGKGA
jgi:class 3 adenylate cyclase/putative methionine-R-sulfoxide reductase with GAF domain